MIRIACAALSTQAFHSAIDELIENGLAQIENEKPNLAVLFFTSHYSDAIKKHLSSIYRKINADRLIGCSAEGVVGPSKEFEHEPAVSLWLGHIPGAIIQPFQIHQDRLEGLQSDADWRRAFSMEPGVDTNLLLFGDPFSLRVDSLLKGLNQAVPGCPIIGGMASSAHSPGENVLLLNDEWYNDGGVGVSICGDVIIDTVISQGCRPIGQPLMITKGEGNVIQELGGKPAFLALNDLYSTLDDDERGLIDQGIFVGRVIDEYKQAFSRGDFLIRNIVGVDQETYALAVMDQIHPGTTIQFHVRDAQSADEDLKALLTPHRSQGTAGALLFSCNGRGTRMYSDSDHDLNVLKTLLDDPPIAGFFCAGELGPIGGQNFVHGHTASIALFRNANYK